MLLFQNISLLKLVSLLKSNLNYKTCIHTAVIRWSLIVDKGDGNTIIFPLDIPAYESTQSIIN